MKDALPSQVSSSVQTVPAISVHVCSDISKSSVGLPSGRTNRLSGIESVFCFSDWVYVMFMLPWKCPGFFGLNVSVRFCIPRGGTSSSSSASMNGWADVTWRLVRLSLPKLKSWIVSWVSVFV